MPLLSNPTAIFAVLMLNIVLAEQLSKLPFFKFLGTALLAILLTAITSNLGIIPASANTPALYDGIFTYLAPMSIFFLLLSVNLRGLRRAGAPMIGMFFLGSIGTMSGVLIGMWFLGGSAKFGESFYALAGMFTGTYIGGSSNFNALAIHYGVNKTGNLYAAAVAADNIITALWMAATLLLPGLFKRFLPREIAINLSAEEQAKLNEEANLHVQDQELLNPQELAILLGIGAFFLYISQYLASLLPQVPMIIFLTTFALVLAQVPWIQRLRGIRTLSMFSIYLFLAVIGAYCDLGALFRDGSLALAMLLMVSITVLVHGLLIFGLGGLFRADWDLVSIASQANVGGSATALALSKSLNRADLHLPGILAGALGNAIGTYCGLMIAEYLR
jgi:uncharacterized membrane protein